MGWEGKVSYYRKKIKRRNKPHSCVLCNEEETHDWDHICASCRHAWRLGVDYQNAPKPPEGTHELLIATHWKLYHFYGKVNRYDRFKTLGGGADSRLKDAVMKLVHATQQSDKWAPKLTTAVGLPEGNRGREGMARYVIVGDEETEQTMSDLYVAACDLMAEAYIDGERQGKSFVTDLIKGKLTTKDLERL